MQRLVDAAVERFGRIDVMLNNAGLMPHSPLERRKIADWDRTIDVNIKGVLYGIAAALPHNDGGGVGSGLDLRDDTFRVNAWVSRPGALDVLPPLTPGGVDQNWANDINSFRYHRRIQHGGERELHRPQPRGALAPAVATGMEAGARFQPVSWAGPAPDAMAWRLPLSCPLVPPAAWRGR